MAIRYLAKQPRSDLRARRNLLATGQAERTTQSQSHTKRAQASTRAKAPGKDGTCADVIQNNKKI